jgi:lactate dehydrogenase-like 2-hydroxyacid dehydrogenase
MGPDQFSAMKPTAFFVNTSRGGVVDQPALVRALTEGQIAGAGLDVLQDEPPSPDDPVLSAPNVIIVPHIGSATVETRNAMAQCAVDNLLMVLRGEGSPFVLPSS